VPATGLLQFGAPAQLIPLLTGVPLQVTIGTVIAVPAVPNEGTVAQASVYVIMELLLELGSTEELLVGVLELLLCTEEDEPATSADELLPPELAKLLELLLLPPPFASSLTSAQPRNAIIINSKHTAWVFEYDVWYINPLFFPLFFTTTQTSGNTRQGLHYH